MRFQLRDGSSFVIRKKLTFWRDKYEFDNLGLRIEGNIWDLNFKLLDDRVQLIAEIKKELFHLTSTYNVTVLEDAYADLVISLCVAIDYVGCWKANHIKQVNKGDNMKQLSSAQVRQMWLDFWATKGHSVEPSVSLVPVNDPTLLWINSG